MLVSCVCPGYSLERLDVASRYHVLLETSGIPQHRWHYWWRAVSATYIIRPTSRTLAEMQSIRNETFPGQHDLSRAISVSNAGLQLR